MKQNKKLIPLVSFFMLLFLLGSTKDRISDKKNSRLGRTHFIVGMPEDQMHQYQKPAMAQLAVHEDSKNDVYFAPDDDVRKELIDIINDEKERILLAMYTFTDKKIAQALCAAHERGVAIEVVADPSFLSSRYTKVDMLYKQGILIYIYDPKRSKSGNGTYNNLMHHKFVIFERNRNNHPLVWTGSYNFTKSARLSNQENVLVVEDPVIAHKYTDQFDQLKERAMHYKQ